MDRAPFLPDLPEYGRAALTRNRASEEHARPERAAGPLWPLCSGGSSDPCFFFGHSSLCAQCLLPPASSVLLPFHLSAAPLFVLYKGWMLRATALFSFLPSYKSVDVLRMIVPTEVVSSPRYGMPADSPS